MRNDIYRDPRTVACTLFAAAAGLLAAGPLSADPLQRLSADFQNNTSLGGSGEIFTTSPPPGILVYSKTVSTGSLDLDTFYVTFSAQGDTHGGSALLMTAQVDGQFCQPLLGQTGTGGGGPHVFPNWYTLSHLPDAGLANVANCNDGGGGAADCHDNTISFTCCVHVEKSASFPNPLVTISLADLPGGTGNTAFYERSTIYVDGVHDPSGALCSPHGSP